MAYRRFSAGLAFTPDGEHVLFVSNLSGQFNLWRVPAEGGWPDQLSAFTDDTVRLMGVSSRDGTVAFCADHDGDEFHQIYLLEPGGGWPEKITDAPDVQHYVGGDCFSPDGTKLAFAANARTPTDMEVWIHDLDTGEIQSLFGEGKYSFPAGWSPDGTKLVALDFRNNSDSTLHLIDLESGEAPEVTPHEEDGLYLPGPWAADGSGFYLLSDESREFRGLAFYDVNTGSWDWVETPEADIEEVGISRDGRQIPAWLYRPEAEGKVPVVLAIHGGPEAQERALYNPLYQYLLSRGIAVMATNIRGSTGYGKSYQRLIQRDWGGGDLKDWDHAVRWLHEQDWVDPDRIGVWGGSYGGFAVLTCVTRLPDYWAAAVDIFGPSNLISFAKAVPPTWRRMMKRFVGDPEEDADLLRERSPMTYIENATTPMLVIQGAKDPRVVQAESDQLVDKLRSLGREVEYIVFDDEGHGFTKRQNELKAHGASAAWLERHLTA